MMMWLLGTQKQSGGQKQEGAIVKLKAPWLWDQQGPVTKPDVSARLLHDLGHFRSPP